jgi:hypothetical protein
VSGIVSASGENINQQKENKSDNIEGNNYCDKKDIEDGFLSKLQNHNLSNQRGDMDIKLTRNKILSYEQSIKALKNNFTIKGEGIQNADTAHITDVPLHNEQADIANNKSLTNSKNNSEKLFDYKQLSSNTTTMKDNYIFLNKLSKSSVMSSNVGGKPNVTNTPYSSKLWVYKNNQDENAFLGKETERLDNKNHAYANDNNNDYSGNNSLNKENNVDILNTARGGTTEPEKNNKRNDSFSTEEQENKINKAIRGVRNHNQDEGMMDYIDLTDSGSHKKYKATKNTNAESYIKNNIYSLDKIKFSSAKKKSSNANDGNDDKIHVESDKAINFLTSRETTQDKLERLNRERRQISLINKNLSLDIYSSRNKKERERLKGFDYELCGEVINLCTDHHELHNSNRKSSNSDTIQLHPVKYQASDHKNQDAEESAQVENKNKRKTRKSISDDEFKKYENMLNRKKGRAKKTT